MLNNWLAMEHYRLHVVEQWPDGPRKQAAIAAVRSSLRSLLANRPEEEEELFVCSVCGNRAGTGVVVEFPARPGIPEEMAA